MDFNTFEAKYGYSAPKQNFKGGARAGIIVASVLSIVLSAVHLVLLRRMDFLYFGTNTMHPASFIPLIAAILMIIAGAAAKPTSKIILAIPVSLFAAGKLFNLFANIASYLELGFNGGELIRMLLNSIPLYTLIVVLLMWLTCGGVIKNGTVGGALIAITSVLGCIILTISNFVQLLDSYGYGPLEMILTANIVSGISAMLFFVANAAASFMIGAKPKAPVYGYVPSAYQTQQPTPQPPVQQVTRPLPTVEEQPTDNNTEDN